MSKRKDSAQGRVDEQSEQPGRIPTTERLAKALEEANAPMAMIQRARDGFYDDYLSPLAGPIMQLVADARAVGISTIAQRAIDGEFDATRDEADAWAKSEDGHETFRMLFGQNGKR